jgi:hypothetical protein
MCLDFFLFLNSPLEQFEIGSFNFGRTTCYLIPFHLENYEINYYSKPVFKAILVFCHGFASF